MFGAWALLLFAIVVEVGATAALPRTHSFREPLWTIAVLGGYAVSIWLLLLLYVTIKRIDRPPARLIWR